MVFIEDYFSKFKFIEYPKNKALKGLFFHKDDENIVAYEETTINLLSRINKIDKFHINRDCDIIFDIKVNDHDYNNWIVMDIGGTVINRNKNGYFPFNKLNPLPLSCLTWHTTSISTSQPINITYKKGYMTTLRRRYLYEQNFWLLRVNYPMSRYYMTMSGMFGKCEPYYFEPIKGLYNYDESDKVYNIFNKVISDISMIPDFGQTYRIAQECFNSIIS